VVWTTTRKSHHAGASHLSCSSDRAGLDCDKGRRKSAQGGFLGREEAIAEAVRLAGSDEPAKVTIDNGDGIIAEEWLFGADGLEKLGT